MATWSGWETSVLQAIGAPVTSANLAFLDAWQKAEGGTATNNPLNTTQTATGATNYNSVGVKNYPDTATGAAATAKTLTNGYYPAIVTALQTGNPLSGAVSAMATELKTWGTGPGFLQNLLGGDTPSATTTGGITTTPPIHAPTGSGDPLAQQLDPTGTQQNVQTAQTVTALLAKVKQDLITGNIQAFITDSAAAAALGKTMTPGTTPTDTAIGNQAAIDASTANDTNPDLIAGLPPGNYWSIMAAGGIAILGGILWMIFSGAQNPKVQTAVKTAAMAA